MGDFFRTQNNSCALRIWGYLDGMGWQQLLSLIVVAVAAVLLVWGKVRRRKFSFGGQGHCGCGAAGQAPKSSIVFHARRGERPRAIVRIR